MRKARHNSCFTESIPEDKCLMLLLLRVALDAQQSKERVGSALQSWCGKLLKEKHVHPERPEHIWASSHSRGQHMRQPAACLSTPSSFAFGVMLSSFSTGYCLEGFTRVDCFLLAVPPSPYIVNCGANASFFISCSLTALSSSASITLMRNCNSFSIITCLSWSKKSIRRKALNGYSLILAWTCRPALI